MAIQFELYKTPRPKDETDKETYHARVVNFQHIDTDYLARQIQTATSLTEGDVKSVLESLLKANQIKLKANISFKADIKLKKSVSVVHLERSKVKRHSASRTNEEVDKLLTNYFSNNSILTRPDFQGLCNFTATTAARHIRRLKEEKKLQNINTYYNPIYAPMPGYYGRAKL